MTRWVEMLAGIPPSSPAALAIVVCCFMLVAVFKLSNGFHDAANAVAATIYTRRMKPVPAVVVSGALNFLGVVMRGVALAFTVVELLRQDVLAPAERRSGNRHAAGVVPAA